MELKKTLKNALEHGCWLQTSGTTGAPKRIFQPVEKLRAANEAARIVNGITKDSRILTVCTPKHAGGLLAQTMPAFEIGAHVDYWPFNAYSWIRNITDYTHSHLTPDMARAVMKTKRFQEADLTGITVMCGSDRVGNDIINAFTTKGVDFIVNWGMTEVGPCAINKRFSPGDAADYEHTIMGDQTYCQTKIVDGELYVKGDIVVSKGWFKTGDSVSKTGNTYYFHGRI